MYGVRDEIWIYFDSDRKIDSLSHDIWISSTFKIEKFSFFFQKDGMRISSIVKI